MDYANNREVVVIDKHPEQKKVIWDWVNLGKRKTQTLGGPDSRIPGEAYLI
jgi:hypothetical protein